MDITSLVGIILGLIAVFVGMVLKGVSLTALINPAAILIIILGTISVILIAFPLSEVKKVPKLLGIIMKNQKTMEMGELIGFFSELAQLARQEGLLALDAKIAEIEDPFLRRGLRFAVDGQSAEYIRDILGEEISAMEARHAGNSSIFSQAGTYAPTLGVLGAVVGLIAALGNLDNPDELGHAIAAAFVATMLGIFTGYVFWHPFANKLKRKSLAEVQTKEIMIEGILSILEGEPPRVIEEKLASYLPVSERQAALAGSEDESDGEEE
ncbi:flagellar motor stator protein MotA [Aciduricibacillus chroicocephali]|uniref:Flagellar motor stator protein MotA n=1 Tax=Aciduricibacillus chroicocephali TaxID=3054939 RepID=A0ABY9KTU6_9BACI|nr:flagellar motor stator protein MotA [Bacillaceae bacterium 44XB]